MMTTGRNRKGLLAMYALGALMAQDKFLDIEEPIIIGGGKPDLKRADKDTYPRLFPDKPKQVIHKGHKKFYINGKEIWALNEKNAVRKAFQ